MSFLRRSATALAGALLLASAAPSLGSSVIEKRRPRYKRLDNIEIVWQRPPTDSPKGIVFFAHGCQHQSTDLFSEVGPDGWRFEACAKSNLGRCLGLPEEVRLRQVARARGYVVMGVSGGRGSKSCWDPMNDADKVSRAVRFVKGEESLDWDAPVIAVGVSSGGSFISYLAWPVGQYGMSHLKCLVSISSGFGFRPNRGVPALFVHMPKDSHTAKEVAGDIENLQTQEIRAAEIRVEPQPVTEELMRRCVSQDAAKAILRALKANNFLDSNNMLKQDPRLRKWIPKVKSAIDQLADDSLEPDESCVFELLNVAWAEHEMTAQYAEQMIDFCEGKGRYSKKKGKKGKKEKKNGEDAQAGKPVQAEL